MADKISMELFPGAKNLDPSAFLTGRDLRDIQVGVEHDPTGQTYNRLAVPWAGAAYTFNRNGEVIKVAGRPGAYDGDEMMDSYPNLVAVWRDFARAQETRPSGDGAANNDFTTLVSQLKQAAQRISQQGRMPEDKGISLRAQKLSIASSFSDGNESPSSGSPSGGAMR